MRIILSRKGFDSSAGGFPSPILPDGRLLSLPIPVKDNDGAIFDDVKFDDDSIGNMVESLTEGKRQILRSRNTHLDPDLRHEARERKSGWLPSFGQSDSAARHLEREGVGEGDLFLFFGWFREAEHTKEGLKFVRGAADLHVIFGWLHIGQKILNPSIESSKDWLRPHPHVSGFSAKPNVTGSNIIYVAKQNLEIDGLESYPGGGVFDRISENLILTDRSPENGNTDLTERSPSNRSVWRLPHWFVNHKLSYHNNQNRMITHEDYVILKSVGRGQEFVFDCGKSNEPIKWVRSMFTQP